jgi:light-regulated signal transduction histidine kinase (bacteriophytochrome)
MSAPGSTVTDLSNCDREPIHTPGSIQPHGFLIVLEPAGWTITGASTNAREFFWREATALIGGSVESVLGDGIVAALERARAQADFAARAIAVDTAEIEVGGEKQRFALVAHASGPHVILEGERAAVAGPLQVEQDMQTFLARLGAVESADELNRLVVTEVRRITGFDRCLLYQFDADWNGTVIAEDRNESLPAYLHQRWPASDIPRQARELYRRNRLRLIPTHTYRPVPIVLRAGGRASELDLSLSVLRSVSPIHLEYMRNMGTGSAMSISVMRGTELWGLISCHSRESRFVPFATRAACDLLGQFLALQLAVREQARELAYRLELTGVLTRLAGDFAQGGGFDAPISAEELLRLGAATGAAIVCGPRVALHGRTPPEAQVRDLAGCVAQTEKPLVFWDKLAMQFPQLAADPAVASGVLAIALEGKPAVTILWFRPEIIEVIEWAGEPRKAIEADGAGRVLHPRKSFESWRETVRGRSRPWEPAVVAAAKDFREALGRVVVRPRDAARRRR